MKQINPDQSAEPRSRAFTLIELLVVIAVISLLAAILFPVFARARESARRANCMSNLKQIGMGVMMYVQDYDESYPPNYNSSNPSNARLRYWGGMIFPYIKNVDAFFCPSSPIEVEKNPYPPTYGAYGANYNVIKNFSVTASNPRHTVPMSSATIQTPATTYMIFDAPGYVISAGEVITPSAYHTFLPGLQRAGGNCDTSSGTSKPTDSGREEYLTDCQSGRHFDGVNMAFADGHVKWLKGEIVRQQAINCTSTLYCGANASSVGHKSAWNPWLDNS